ncbi:MAG: hypothetical protein ACQEUZ_00515 [Pseudomonadota bacterium]
MSLGDIESGEDAALRAELAGMPPEGALSDGTRSEGERRLVALEVPRALGCDCCEATLAGAARWG